MGPVFWLRRFLLVFAVAAVVIAAAQLLKGHSLAYSLSQAAVWAALSAGLFVVARIYQSRRGQHCALCRDTVEMRDPTRPPERR